MGKDTLIHWADSSVNPTAGCSGCELWVPGKGGPCYAGAIHNRFSPSKAYPGPFEQISLHPGRMAQAARWSDLTGKPRPDKPWLDGMPRIIFVSDMSDALSRDVPFEYLADEIIANVISDHGRRHIWMWLTKLPSRMAEFSSVIGWWPENLWAGTSVTSKKTLRRVEHLFRVPAAVRFVSAEPLWEEIDLRDLPSGGNAFATIQMEPGPDGCGVEFPCRPGIQLVIVGGQSGPDARPFDLAWARKLRDDCKEAGVAYFLKQYGSRPFDSFYRSGVADQRIHLKDGHGGDWSEWGESMKVREFPRIPSPMEALA
jgi:protein gp37